MPRKQQVSLIIDAITQVGSRASIAGIISAAQQDGTIGEILKTTNTRGESPLICAIKKGYTDISKTLIELGADVNFKVKSTYKTPLMYAVESGNLQAVELLVNTPDIEIHVRDKQGFTARDIAYDESNEAIVQTLPDQLMKFSLCVFKDDLDIFKSCRTEEAKEMFIKGYIDNHRKDGITSADIVLGLMLNTAIVLEDIDLIKDIVGIVKLKHHNNILDIVAYLDGHNYSVVSSTLYSGDAEILNIIGSLIEEASLEKVAKHDCMPEDLSNLETIIRCPQFEDFSPSECVDRFVRPVYDEESIASIESLLGQCREG